MINFSRLRCLKDSPSFRVILQRTSSTVSQISTKYRKVCHKKDMTNCVKCKECGHFIGRSAFDYMEKAQRFYTKLGAEKFGVQVLIPMMTVLLGVALFFVRRYNYSFAYGTGGCRTIMFWPYNQCEVEV